MMLFFDKGGCVIPEQPVVLFFTYTCVRETFCSVSANLYIR